MSHNLCSKGANGTLRTYSEQACLYDCRLRYASAKAGCVPWDYPVPSDLQAVPFCLADTPDNQLRGFERAMSSNTSLEGCDCTPNCEEVVFKQQARASM